jgi:hypothetical protein
MALRLGALEDDVVDLQRGSREAFDCGKDRSGVHAPHRSAAA